MKVRVLSGSSLEGGRFTGHWPGTAIDSEDALAFSVRENIRPMIEIVPSNRLRMPMLAWCRAKQGFAWFWSLATEWPPRELPSFASRR